MPYFLTMSAWNSQKVLFASACPLPWRRCVIRSSTGSTCSGQTCHQSLARRDRPTVRRRHCWLSQCAHLAASAPGPCPAPWQGTALGSCLWKHVCGSTDFIATLLAPLMAVERDPIFSQVEHYLLTCWPPHLHVWLPCQVARSAYNKPDNAFVSALNRL